MKQLFQPCCMACGTVISRVPALLLKHVVSLEHVEMVSQFDFIHRYALNINKKIVSPHQNVCVIM